MKTLFTILILFKGCLAKAQGLKNSEWIQIKVERKDGSRILERTNSQNNVVKYYFKEHTVLISLNSMFGGELAYSVSSKILKIGEFAGYDIDSVNSKYLMISQRSERGLTDDRLNRYTFINRNYLFQYLKEKNLITFINDSTIEVNKYLAPSYYGTLQPIYEILENSRKNDKYLEGKFTMNPKGFITSIAIDTNHNFTSKELIYVSRALHETDGSWSIPFTPKPFNYRFPLLLSYSNKNYINSHNFSIIPKDNDTAFYKSLSLDEMNNAEKYYNNGNEYMEKGDLENAIKFFVKCIYIDKIYIEAYYNLAYCYEKLHKRDLSCDIWNRLKILGQKEGETLFYENCK